MRALGVVLMLSAGLALGQVAHVCGAGKNCTVKSLKTSDTGTARAPICMATPPGTGIGQYVQMRMYTTDQFGIFTGSDCDSAVGYLFGVNSSSGIIQIGPTSGGYYATAAAGFRPPAGTVALPSYGFSGDTNTGVYNVGADQLGVSAAGANVATFSADGVNSVAGYSAALSFASFPACSGNPAATGRLLYDATEGVWRWCNGTAWKYFLGSATSATDKMNAAGGFFAVSDYTAAAAAENSNFFGTFMPPKAELVTDYVSCNWATAGTGGATGVVFQVYDVTTSASACTCTLGACTTAARTPKTCKCSATLVAGREYAARITSGTDCTANPQNISCNVSLIPTL